MEVRKGKTNLCWLSIHMLVKYITMKLKTTIISFYQYGGAVLSYERGML